MDDGHRRDDEPTDDPNRERKKTMKLNPIKRLFDDRNRKTPVLLAVTPPRTGERTMLGVENMLQSIAVPEPFSLELAGDIDGVTLLARCLDDQVVRGQVTAHYPQARIHALSPEEDPLRVDEGEQAWAMTLRADGPEYVPLRVFRDDDLLDPGSDPLIALLGALSNLNDNERIVARLMLRSLGPDWSQNHLEKAHKRPVEERRDPSYTYQTKPLQTDGVTMAVLGLAALAALRGYLWVQAGETWKAVLMGVGVTAALVAGGWLWHRIKKARKRVYDPLLIKEKVARIAFDGELQIVAVLPAMADQKKARERAKKVLEPVAAAYRHYDHPAGARFRVSRVRPIVPDPSMLHPTGPGLFGKRSILGVREAAALWHPPGAGDETPLVERSGARVLMPSARGVRGGAPVGQTTAGKPRPIHFPEDLLRRHHLYVARTRMGKSTLMHHIVRHKLREKAAGRDGDAIVVVDPHADLVGSLLRQVPESLIDQVRLIDLADDRGAPGVNLLDTRIFPDRDRTADSVVRIAKGLWDQWGPRMQSILEQTVKTLHEANEHPSTSDDEQLTILDGLTLLADDKFRSGVLAKVSDHYLLQWWGRDFKGWRGETRADALAPVQTRLSYYASSKRARAILGQPRSTIDMRRVIRDGGILLVSTAQGKAGKDVAALVGASLLNLVDAVIREQGSLSPERRRGALIVVDEMQSMPGVDYESMLSGAGQVRGQLRAGHPEPRQAGRPLPHHARHPACQHGLPGRLPGGGQRRQATRVGAGQGPGERGGHRVPPRPPVLRPRHRGHRADARLLHDGEQARGRRPRHRRAHQGKGVLLPHHRGGDRRAAGRGPKAGRGLPQGRPGHQGGQGALDERAEGRAQGPGAGRAAQQALPAAHRQVRPGLGRRGG